MRLRLALAVALTAAISAASAAPPQFDAKPNLSQAQCAELATAKLKEAIESVLSGLIKD